MQNNQEFYTCRNEKVFKEIFGNEKNKDLLECLLESMSDLEEDETTYPNIKDNIDIENRN